MNSSAIWKLSVTVGVSLAAGFVGSLFTASSVSTWYAGLLKPALNPPSWVFAPVWTTLYVLMGIAAFLVWQHGWERREVRAALAVFAVQLALNALWSVVFFGWRAPGAAFMDILLLWLAIAATVSLFSKVSRTAAWLLAPYVLWVSFAMYLNVGIWLLN